jgi:zinc/manganese transport system permease protein
MILLVAAARLWAATIGGLIAIAAGIAVLASASGLLLSYHLSLPSGPAIILVAGMVYALSLVIGPVGGIVARTMPRPHPES